METKERLEYLRGELRAQRISYGELNELQGLKDHIAPDDVELREAAGIPEVLTTDEEVIDLTFSATDLPKDTPLGVALIQEITAGLDGTENEVATERYSAAYNALMDVRKHVSRMMDELEGAMKGEA